MSVSPTSSIGAALIGAANKVTSDSASSSVSSAIDEANESKATTAKEAKNGDPVARKRLKQLKAKEDQQAAQTKATEPGKGVVVDKQA